ncbi:Na-translocating system protein MpsC family protein [Thalassobacillus sp. C254]|uniref:Na-translocating system protein MpsC family protein n=1 Tax=Thalassobacillus sp. C254 TaxID=1225341 RepID=UPI0035B55F83
MENKIAGYVGRMIRNHFGKGPKSVYVTISYPYITIYLEDFLGQNGKCFTQEKRSNDRFTHSGKVDGRTLTGN